MRERWQMTHDLSFTSGCVARACCAALLLLLLLGGCTKEMGIVGVSVQASHAAGGDWVRVYAHGYPNPPTPVPDGVSAGRPRELSCFSGDSFVTTLLEGSSETQPP